MMTMPSNKLEPGTVEGDGYMCNVFAISDSQAIEKVLGQAYHTVSIGAYVESIIESISGVDIIAAQKKANFEPPPYYKGQVYKVDGKEQLSYWIMGPLDGREISYVNSPSDPHAGTMDPDIGEKGIQLLMGEKKMGSETYAFFDPITKKEVVLDTDEFVFDESFMFVDSLKIGDLYLTDVNTKESAEADGSAQAAEPEATKESTTATPIDAEKLAPVKTALEAVVSHLKEASGKPLFDDSVKNLLILLGKTLDVAEVEEVVNTIETSPKSRLNRLIRETLKSNGE